MKRIYYLPYVPTLEGAFAHTFEGSPFDVDAFLATPYNGPPIESIDRTATVQRDTLIAIARRLKRSKNFEHVDCGVRILAALNGEPFAEMHDRDNTLWRLAQVLGKRLPRSSPQSIADYFGTSLSLMGTDCPTVEVFAEKIERIQDETIQNEGQAVVNADARYRARILEVLGREEPYSEQELATFLETEQCDVATFAHRWIIQCGKHFWFYVNGEYAPSLPKDSATNAIHSRLAPAPCQLHDLNAQGVAVLKPFERLIEEYGTVADNVAVDLTAQRTRYDGDTRTIVEATARIPKHLNPIYSSEVDRFLQIYAGADYPVLCKWLSHLTQLESPCTMLLLTGKKGVGKSFLACLCASVYGKNEPVELASVIADFNSPIKECPVVFGDETMPSRQGKAFTMKELRPIQSRRVHALKEKFKPESQIRGALRIVLAANSLSMVRMRETLNADDLDAYMDRFTHIDVKTEARAYLESNPSHRSWVEDGTFAQHVLWLAQNRTEPQGRFLVKSESLAIRGMMVSSGLRSEMCHFCVAYLCSPQLADNDGSYHLRIHDRKLYVSPQAFERYWPTYIRTMVPALDAINTALRAIAVSDSDPIEGTDGHGKPCVYHVIDTRNLVAWNDHVGFTTTLHLLACLDTPTEIRVQTQVKVPYRVD